MARVSIASALTLGGALCACSTATDPVADGDVRDDPTEVSSGSPSAGPDPDEGIRRLLVHHHMAECYGLRPRLCMLVRESEEDEWSFMFDDIEGFEYRWGHGYDLRIAVRDVPDPPQDASAVANRLIETTSETAVDAGTSFDFPSVWAPELIARNENGRFHLDRRREFTCAPADCDTLASLLDQELSVLLRFRHPADPAAPLELARIPCSDAEESFRDTCLP